MLNVFVKCIDCCLVCCGFIGVMVFVWFGVMLICLGYCVCFMLGFIFVRCLCLLFNSVVVICFFILLLYLLDFGIVCVVPLSLFVDRWVFCSSVYVLRV